MKDYINLFHDMIDKFHFWEDLKKEQKKVCFCLGY